MRLTKKYKSVYFNCNNESYEMRVYAVKENEEQAERYDLMIYKDYKKVSLFVYSIDMKTHPNYKNSWLDPETALKYLFSLAVNDITSKRIYPYVQGKFMGLEEVAPPRHLYKVQ